MWILHQREQVVQLQLTLAVVHGWIGTFMRPFARPGICKEIISEVIVLSCRRNFIGSLCSRKTKSIT